MRKYLLERVEFATCEPFATLLTFDRQINAVAPRVACHPNAGPPAQTVTIEELALQGLSVEFVRRAKHALGDEQSLIRQRQSEPKAIVSINPLLFREHIDRFSNARRAKATGAKGVILDQDTSLRTRRLRKDMQRVRKTRRIKAGRIKPIDSRCEQ